MRKEVRQKIKCCYRFMHNYIEDTERNYITEAHPDLFRAATLRPLAHFPTFSFGRLTNLQKAGATNSLASCALCLLIQTDGGTGE